MPNNEFIPQSNKAIILIAERIGFSGGGEAIKAQQYADYLLDQGYELRVISHIRSKASLGADLPDENLWLMDDTPLQKFFWSVRPLRPFLEVYFHIVARLMIKNKSYGRYKPILHYISPVSPVALRFPVKGFRIVIGPMTGSIYYPPGFRYRMSVGLRIREALHSVAQVVFGRIMKDKKNADILLVSGYERTRASLRIAGCSDEKMVDVVDSGVSAKLRALPRMTHQGENLRFMCSGRTVDHKGIDLAIKAVARSHPKVTLDIYGDGVERKSLEELVGKLGLADRVKFKGWLAEHNDLISRFADYRGYIFPSLAEANGIVMQEAMMVGLPVVALRCGGPEKLADDSAAIYIEPTNEAVVVSGLSKAMNRLAKDSAYAEKISKNAREIAELEFSWDAVSRSWQESYPQ